jgi:glucosylceramidase
MNSVEAKGVTIMKPSGPMSNIVIALVFLGLVAGAGLTRGQTVSVWLTTYDQTQKMQPQAPVTFSAGTSGTNPIIVDETQTYQQIEGFGAAFTDTTGYNLNEVATTSGRNNAMTNLFTRNGGGIGLSFMRCPMGASDLARYIYSYDDLPNGQTDTNLSLFSIAHDQADIIPLIQQALQLNPQLEIMANPWSPPGWMKATNSMIGVIGGPLQTNIYTPFANYFVKYIQAYQAAGIVINYISLQNEPLYSTPDYPGMYMDAAAQLNVLRDYVLPALSANNLTNTRVLVYDHNWDEPSYPATVLSDPTVLASAQVAGTAWHGYAGTPGVMLTSANQFPTKGNYETEHTGSDGNTDQVKADFEEITHCMRSWAKTYLKWNLAGNQADGPHTGGCDDCTPLVYVNTNTLAVSYSIDFYTLGQFSKFVLPGAYRIYSGNGAGIVSAAFLNPDGSKALVAFNDTTNSQTFQVQWGTQSFGYTLASYAGATFTWTGTQNGGYAVNPTNQIEASSFNSVANGLQTEPTSDTQGGYDLGYANTGGYAVYQNVNLASGFTNVSARVASAGSGGTLQFRLDSPTGPLAGSIVIPVTGGWQTWQTVTGAVTGGSGLHNLYLVFNGGSSIGNLNWFQFSGALPPLPNPWVTADIGSVGLAGSASYLNGTYTLSGSGADIWNAADAFRYADQPVNGNCEIRARVTSLQNTDPWAKAGVMLRDGTAAGAINAAVLITRSNGVAFQVRSTTGVATTSTAIGAVTAPNWVRLVRGSSNLFTGYYSSDGANWTQIGSSVNIPMSNAALAGLEVTAHNNASNCVATFDNVSVNQSPVLAPIPDQTILAGRVLTVTNSASDADVPSQTLTFSLISAPSGATINTNTGLFTWRPTIAQSPSAPIIAIAVSDNGLPSMSATQSFTATVTRPVAPNLNAVSITNNNIEFQISGDTGPDYIIQTSTNLTSWSSIATSNSPTLPFFWIDTNSAALPFSFYRVLLGP